MNEDYCDYKLSLALKAAGFDYGCYYYYTKRYSDNAVVCLYSKESPTDYNKMPGAICSMPTLWQAQKWLREKHRLHILVDFDLYGKWYYKLFPIGGCCVDEGNSGYTTNEAALSAGILAALDLITKGE